LRPTPPRCAHARRHPRRTSTHGTARPSSRNTSRPTRKPALLPWQCGRSSWREKPLHAKTFLAAAMISTAPFRLVFFADRTAPAGARAVGHWSTTSLRRPTASMNSVTMSNTTTAAVGCTLFIEPTTWPTKYVARSRGLRIGLRGSPIDAPTAGHRSARSARACRAGRGCRASPTHRSKRCAACARAYRSTTAIVRCLTSWRPKNLSFTTGSVSASSVVNQTEPPPHTLGT